MSESQQPDPLASCELDRRSFMRRSSAVATTVVLGELFAGRVLAQDASQTAQLVAHPRVRLAALADLAINRPVLFDDPSEQPHSGGMLVKLGERSGGGIGPDQDVVAFSTRCTHMGGDMSDGFVAAHQVLGCAEHQTTFDLTRHGMVVAGHATSALPQIVLEVEDDAIFATGLLGLLYGYNQNPG